MVESRKSLVVRRAALVLNQIQLSLTPWPIVLDPLSFSYSARFLSYCSRETLLFVRSIVAAGTGVAARFALLLFTTRTFTFVSLPHADSPNAMQATIIAIKIVFAFILVPPVL